MPMERFTVMMTPKWITSMPKWAMIGIRIGVSTRIAEVGSRTQPKQ